MVDLLDLLHGQPSGPSKLTEVRLSAKLTPVVFFTTDAETVTVHYEEDPTSPGYVQCIGDGCLYCRFGDKPQAQVLLPVVHLESGEVRILRMSKATGTKALLGQILPFLKRADVADIAVEIARSGRDYLVTSFNLAPTADHGDEAVRGFQAALAAGLKLESVVRRLTLQEMAEIPRMRKLLSLRGITIPGAD